MEDDVVGRVLRLQRYPLKGADGERLQLVDVTESGLADDRRWALARPDGAAVTAKEAPSLRGVQASSVDGRLQLQPPLAHVMDGDVQVLDAPGRNQNVAAVHLASEGAAAAADAPTGCDPEPRANVVLDLPEPGAERSWIGRRLRLGDVELRVTRTPAHCLGVYAEVVAPGEVHVGDAVHLLP